MKARMINLLLEVLAIVVSTLISRLVRRQTNDAVYKMRRLLGIQYMRV
jgi:hypothetical protein